MPFDLCSRWFLGEVRSYIGGNKECLDCCLICLFRLAARLRYFFFSLINCSRNFCHTRGFHKLFYVRTVRPNERSLKEYYTEVFFSVCVVIGQRLEESGSNNNQSNQLSNDF